MSTPNSIRTDLLTIRGQNYQTYQKSLHVTTSFSLLQQKSYGCENLCRDAINAVTPVLLDNYDTSSYERGAELAGVVGQLRLAQDDITVTGPAAGQEVAGCLTDLQSTAVALNSLLASMSPGPAQQAVSTAISLMNQGLGKEAKIQFPVDDLLKRGTELLDATAEQAGEIAADSPKNPGDVSAAGHLANRCVFESKALYSQTGAKAMDCGVLQSQVSSSVLQATEQIDLAIQQLDAS